MAKMERILHGDFNEILGRIENGIMRGSVSASLEDSSDFSDGSSRCSVRVFERYSAMGSNRVSSSRSTLSVSRHSWTSLLQYCKPG